MADKYRRIKSSYDTAATWSLATQGVAIVTVGMSDFLVSPRCSNIRLDFFLKFYDSPFASDVALLP